MAIMLFFFKTKWSVMGANDNLSGIAVLQGIAETLGTNKKLIPNHTKILLVSFGSEEAGLRGSKRWIKRHKDELDERPFYFLNFDGLAKKTAGYSGSDLYDVVQAVHLLVVREVFKSGDAENLDVKLRSITKKDFYEVISKRKPSVYKKSLILYDKWFKKLKAL